MAGALVARLVVTSLPVRARWACRRCVERGWKLMARLGLNRTGNSSYARGYLRSPTWFARRRRWFAAVRAAGMEPGCLVCGATEASAAGLDLHHVSYAGVEKIRGRWVAGEDDEDLMPLCREHHSRLHRMMDRRKDFYGWDRERASIWIVSHLIRENTKTKTTRTSNDQ